MKISVVAIVLSAVAGISATPIPNGPVTALEERASDTIGSFMSFFRRNPGSLEGMQSRSPNMPPRKKVEVRVVGRAISLPIEHAGGDAEK